MSVLVTGAAGFLGREVCDELCALGMRVIAAARSATALGSLRRRLRTRGADCDTLCVDLAEGQLDVPDLSEVTSVVHLASPVPSAQTNDVDMLIRAERTLLGLMELERRMPSLEHLTFVSSVAVYGTTFDGIAREDSAIPGDLGAYALHKILAESRLGWMSRVRGWGLSILRPTQIFGPAEPHRLGLTRIVQEAVRDRRIVLENGGQDERDLVYVRDAAAAVARATARKLVGVFNVSSGSGVRIRHIARLVLDELDGAVTVVAKPVTRPPTRFVYDNARLAGALGYRPDTPLATGVRACIAYERQEFDGARRGE